MEIEVRAEGFAELMENLDTFCSPKVQIKLVQNAVREGARPVKADAERRLGKGKGHIVVGIPKKKGWGSETIASIGIGIAAKHWQDCFIEYGSRAHRIVAGRVTRLRDGISSDITGLRKRGRWRVGMGGAKEFWMGSGAKALFFNLSGKPVFRKWANLRARSPNPFLRPALDSKKNEALDRMRRYLELALSAIIERKQKMIPTVSEVE